jgi:hypothetical protein
MIILIIIIAIGVMLGLTLYNNPGAIGRAALFIVAVVALTYVASFFGAQP